MDTYWYLSVSFPNTSRRYSYLSDDGPLPIGTRVAVPFGKDNDVSIGTVEACSEHTAETAPYPPERTKHILHVVTAEEYEAQLAPDRDDAPDDDMDDEDVAEALKDVDMLIYEEDWDGVFEWASEHHDALNDAIARKVVSCYQRLVDLGHPVAALNLGTFYYRGRIVPQDYIKAFALYKLAADAGEVRAICNCGYCFYYGRHQQVDYAEAYKWFTLGALLSDDANCLYKLGDMYMNGCHVEKNEKYGFTLYMRAMRRCHDDEDPSCLADTQLRVGRCLLYGTGVERDIEGAHAHLSMALLNFYHRRGTDSFALDSIARTKQLIHEAQLLLDREAEALHDRMR
ncbi:MAG: hypothetical protein E7317_02690 [Clostridiales bacterium]|nr:hypothetical protein [Clostridiales bacterium]